MASRYAEAEEAYGFDADDTRAIPNAADRLDNAVDELRELVSVFEKRLSSVLAPEQATPGEATETMKAARTRSDHAERLSSLVSRVHESRSRLGNLLARLDV